MFSQRVTRETRALTQMVWVLATGVIIILPVALLLDGLPDAGEWRGAGLAALAGVLYFGALFCLLRGLNVGDLGLVSALMSLQGAYLAVVVIVLLGEPVTPLLGAALALCVVGAVLTSIEGRAKSDAGRALGASPPACSSPASCSATPTRRHRLALADGDLAHRVAAHRPAGRAAHRQPRRAPGAARPRRRRRRLELCGLVAAHDHLRPRAGHGRRRHHDAVRHLRRDPGLRAPHERPKPNQWAGIACTIAGVSLLAAVV